MHVHQYFWAYINTKQSQLKKQARRKRATKSQAAKRLTESTKEVEARRKKESEAQATNCQPETPQIATRQGHLFHSYLTK